MFSYTVSKKKLMRTIIILLAALIIVGVIVMAVMSSFKVAAADKKIPIYSVSRSDNKIALTFDCAWGNSNTDLLLSLLKDAGAKATFFVTGEFCDKYPEDVKKMYNEGHEIGNHSDAHPHVKGININKLIEDTRSCSQKIKMITGEEPKLYRAPYGEYDNNAVTTIEGMGLKFIQWSVDSIDWKEPSADTIIKRIEKGTVSGSILLFHNDLENTAQALPQILADLKQKGFTFVKVSDMVYYDSYHIDSSGMQIFDVSALLPTLKYSDNRLLNETMEIFRQNLTMEDIYALSGGATPQLLEKTAPLLDAEHKAAVEQASFEELKEAVQNLITIAEREGAGGGMTGDNQSSQTPVQTADPENTSNQTQGSAPEPSNTSITPAQTTAKKPNGNVDPISSSGTNSDDKNKPAETGKGQAGNSSNAANTASAETTAATAAPPATAVTDAKPVIPSSSQTAAAEPPTSTRMNPSPVK